MKICPGCKEPKDNSEYYRDPRNRDGLYTYCKVCHKAMVMQRKRFVRYCEGDTELAREMKQALQEAAKYGRQPRRRARSV